MTAMISRAELDKMRDRNGVTVAEAMREVGLDPDRLDEARLDPATVHAFVELHIEQAEVLESTGLQMGVVTHIAAPHDLRVTLRDRPYGLIEASIPQSDAPSAGPAWDPYPML